MNRPDTPQPAPKDVSTSGKPRIQTQIHRRQKAKAIPPMEDEWVSDSPSPPNLRTPRSHMKKSSWGRKQFLIGIFRQIIIGNYTYCSTLQMLNYLRVCAIIPSRNSRQALNEIGAIWRNTTLGIASPTLRMMRIMIGPRWALKRGWKKVECSLRESYGCPNPLQAWKGPWLIRSFVALIRKKSGCYHSQFTGLLF